MRSASARAIASVTSFSRVPPWPMAPGSWPPCPASTATMTSRLPSPGACTARTARASACGAAAVATSPRTNTSCRPRPASPVQGLCGAERRISAAARPAACRPAEAPKRTAVTTPAGAGRLRRAAWPCVAEVDDDAIRVLEGEDSLRRPPRPDPSVTWAESAPAESCIAAQLSAAVAGAQHPRRRAVRQASPIKDLFYH